MARKVLIADDSPTVQKKASGVLTGEGMEVVTVSNGVAAIKKLPTVLPMVILADIAMPGKDGYEVCEFVKGSKEYANVPVILVFSDDDVLDEQKGARVRADARIRKPFDRDELISTVNKYLAIAEAAAAKPEPPPPVIKAPLPPEFVNEPVDEEPEIAPKEESPDFSAFGGGVAFAEPALEEIQAEPAPAVEYEIQPEGSSAMEAAPQVTEEPIIEVEESPTPAASSEFVAEMPPPQVEEPVAPPETPAPAEPVLIEELAAPEHQEEHEHPHEHVTERTIMFRAPADIAQPVLSDELSPAPAQEETPAAVESSVEAAPPLVSSEVASLEETAEIEALKEPAPVSPTTLESYSLSEAAAGNVRLAPAPVEPEVPVAEPEPAAVEPEPAAVAEETPVDVASETEAPSAPAAEVPQALDPAQVYSIVYMVVAKMSPRLPPQAIEEIAKPLANEINAELNAPSIQTS